MKCFPALVRDAFLLVLFWTSSWGVKVRRFKGVKSKGRGAEKATGKKKKYKNTMKASWACTEAFLGVSAHQSNLITVSERMGAERIRQCVC